jgi:uncharacterized membrane protein YoaK (UPF0700 family)
MLLPPPPLLLLLLLLLLVAVLQVPLRILQKTLASSATVLKVMLAADALLTVNAFQEVRELSDATSVVQ